LSRLSAVSLMDERRPETSREREFSRAHAPEPPHQLFIILIGASRRRHFLIGAGDCGHVRVASTMAQGGTRRHELRGLCALDRARLNISWALCKTDGRSCYPRLPVAPLSPSPLATIPSLVVSITRL
jgi:hypothetical protein